MSTFYFRAVASDGKVRTGSLTGESEKSIARELRKQGLTVLSVGAQQRKERIFKLPTFTFGKQRDILFFTQELATLLNAGIPVDRALSITCELAERPAFRQVLLEILRTLKSGKSLADSLATHPEYFSDLGVNMVRAGEASGNLAIVFTRLAEFTRTRDELRGYIISSMIYPGLLMLVGIGSIFLMMNFVVPRFAAVFSESRMRIPLPTQIMLEASRIVRSYWWIVATLSVGGFAAFRIYVRSVAGRMWWDTLRLRIPLLGDALLKAETARFARAMATLVANSVPLVQSLGIARAILNNRKVAVSLDSVALGIKRGEGIAAPIRKAGVFPPLAGHLLSVGEETGRLDEMFSQMADIYEKDTREAIKRFTSIFEPLVILVMGVMVGALVLSMLLAITSINEVAV